MRRNILKVQHASNKRLNTIISNGKILRHKINCNGIITNDFIIIHTVLIGDIKNRLNGIMPELN